MVSFCDIKLSQIKDHSEKYGEFGLGLTKNGLRKMISSCSIHESGSELFSKYNKRIRKLKDA
ncbi:abortive infection system antitoxin AbiGi family protein (plasmid) [Escherichia coli]|uniref:abortive infection system antitoxin AbiGi family protein n=1 Tax=Escherichia coli TaxID=562 RepID=UPI00244DFCDA|nr:abortive infection system antitoxin AbiGi family protein [Escherichia coli]WGI94134.1 abortive infection system antitoxin AbiGi family protein [Escherichia coli]